MRSLIIGGIAVPRLASLEVAEVVEPIAARARYRMADGKFKTRTAWSGAWRVLIDLRGTIPPGLSALDWDAGVQIACTRHQAITSGTNVITLPQARRADAGSQPYGRALVAGRWVRTPLALTGDLATLDVVAGATVYQAVLFPLLTVFGDGPALEYSRDSELPHGWRLEAETEGAA